MPNSYRTVPDSGQKAFTKWLLDWFSLLNTEGQLNDHTTLVFVEKQYVSAGNFSAGGGRKTLFICKPWIRIRWDYTHSSGDFSLWEVCSEPLWSRERQNQHFKSLSGSVWWNLISMKDDVEWSVEESHGSFHELLPHFTACKFISDWEDEISHQCFCQQLSAMLSGELQRFGLLPAALAESEVELGSLAFPRRSDATDITVRPLDMPERSHNIY